MAISFSASGAIGQKILIVHCLDGRRCPTGAPETNVSVVREIYALSNSGETKLADWVAYWVTSQTIGTSNSLDLDWQNEDLLDPQDTLEGEDRDSRGCQRTEKRPDDYYRANREIGTDRGHQAPLATFAGTHFWRVTNIVSNITPQKSGLNQGPWMHLEGAVRDAAYAAHPDPLYVVTGPLYDPSENQMQLPRSDEDHQVPTGYFKAIAKGKRLTTFIFDQDVSHDRKDDKQYCKGIATLDDVEVQSGLSLFSTADRWSGDLVSELGCAAGGCTERE